MPETPFACPACLANEEARLLSAWARSSTGRRKPHPPAVETRVEGGVGRASRFASILLVCMTLFAYVERTLQATATQPSHEGPWIQVAFFAAATAVSVGLATLLHLSRRTGIDGASARKATAVALSTFPALLFVATFAVA